MADTIAGTVHERTGYVVGQRAMELSLLWRRLALGGVVLISLFMNFFQLGQNGFSNLYYAAGVKSMADSWHNFFFVSYDPGGFVSLDKPPLGFWLQVASVKLFGFTAFSVYLPQALAGVLAVLLLYHLVRRHFGVVAGLLAGLALALSPISVVTNRNNTIDSVLALVLLLGAWAVLRAAETDRLRWLLLCAAIVGIGFNIKMLEAYLVVPAFGLLYLLAAPRSVWKRIGHLALAGVLLLAISLSWMLAVDLTPASQRPYVGSSQDNSAISLAFGYNGISRLLGPTRGGPPANGGTPPNGAAGNGVPFAGPPPAGPGGPGGVGGPAGGGPGGAGGFFDTGTAGPLRLFIEPLGGQIGWLLPLAILGALALAWQRRPRFQSDYQQQSLLLWGMWLLTMGIFFSVAGFFHQYYLTELAPAICALVGIGIVVMWHDYRRSGWRGWLLPFALLATTVEQVNILMNYPAWGQWLIPLIVIPCLLAAGTLVVIRLLPSFKDSTRSMRPLILALSIGTLVLFIAPTVWAAIPVIQNSTAQLPVAGPTQRGGLGSGPGGNAGPGPSGSSESASADSALLRYLEANQGKAQFLLATASSHTADGIILATNKPVMALGGFGGSDPILTTSQLSALVTNGTVRFFLLGAGGGGIGRQPPPQFFNQNPGQFRGFPRGGPTGPGGDLQNSATSWVTQHCSTVPTNLWQSSDSTNAGAGGPGGPSQLYDCATTH